MTIRNLTARSHFERIKDAANNVFTLKTLSKFVEKHLILEGKPYRFGDKYGFQATIINDTSRVTNTVKPAQIGLTVSTMAYIVAAATTQDKFNSIYSLPTANDAQKLVATKLNPLIHGSPEVYRHLNKDVDNNELKEIRGNFIFVRGSKSETAALSISADALVADEIDRSDPDTLKQFRSRLQASPLQIIKQFSTPTTEGVGISKEAETSRRFRHFARCACCGHVWLPSYHTDIVIPGYGRPLEEITKTTIKDIDWQHARWNCPKCGNDPKLHPRNLQWVCENVDHNYEAHTYYVTPVTACLVLPPSYLVRTSTEFNTRSEWKNQVLGETSQEENEQITADDVSKAEIDIPLISSDLHYMGVDIGLFCAITIGREDAQGNLLVVHREMVHLSQLETRRAELVREYKVHMSVHDLYPEKSLVGRICSHDPNAWAAGFVEVKSPEIFKVREVEEGDSDDGLGVRLVRINRTPWLDGLKELFKQRRVFMTKTDQTAVYAGHYTSLRRVMQMHGGEMQYRWLKTDGEDHMLFSLGYLWQACQLRYRSMGWASDEGLSIVRSFINKNYR